MYILVKKHVIHETGAAAQTSKDYPAFDDALADLHKYANAYTLDKTVERYDIVILNDTLIPCKQEHYIREYPNEVVETGSEEAE